MKPNLVLFMALTALSGALSADAEETLTAAFPGMLLVANKGDHTLGLIDPVAGRMIATVPEDGVTGHEVVASPDGKLAFVPIYGNAGVGRAGTDGQLVRVIDLEKRLIVGTVDFGKAESHMLAITRDGRRGYTSNVGPGTISVLDLEAKKVLAVIPVSKNAQRISLSVDDRWVFTSDQTKPQLAVIDTRTNGINTWIEMPGCGYGTAPTPDGRWLIVALINVNKVCAIDLTTMKVAHTWDVPRAPQEVLVRPDGAEAYVSCDASRQIAVIDVKDWKVKKLIDAGPGADGLAWAGGK